MFEIIVFIIIVLAISKAKQKSIQGRPPRSFPEPPPVFQKSEPKSLSPSEVNKKINKRIFGTENLKDKEKIYNRLILTNRYQSMEKMAHELNSSKYRVLKDIQDLKKQGFYPHVEIDERNFRLIYADSPRKGRPASRTEQTIYKKAKKSPKPPVRPLSQETAPKEAAERTFIEPSKPYRPARNAAERYEEWMEVPPGKEVVRCGYCAADNLIPAKADPHRFTCYFCREELS